MSPRLLLPRAPGRWDIHELNCHPLGGFVQSGQGAGREGRKGGVWQLSSPSTPSSHLAHLSLPHDMACPLQCQELFPWPSPACTPVTPWVIPHAGTPPSRGWASSAALGELFGSKTLISSFRPCPFSPFLFLCLSLSLLLPTSHLCHSDCRVKLWNYVPGLTPCLPRRVLAIKGRATSLP